MSKWRYRLSCPDCTGEDFQGCFDGGTELSEETYDTKEEAEAAGHEATVNSIWAFEVEEDDDDALRVEGEK